MDFIICSGVLSVLSLNIRFRFRFSFFCGFSIKGDIL